MKIAMIKNTKRAERQKKFDNKMVNLYIDRYAIEKEVIDMVAHNTSNNEIISFLRKDKQVSIELAQEIIYDARQAISMAVADNMPSIFDETVLQLKTMFVENKSDKRLQLDILKELNKMLGNYKPVKVDITSEGDNIFEVRVPDEGRVIDITSSDITDKSLDISDKNTDWFQI